MCYCCINCFDDKFLNEYIVSNGQIGDCSFCDSKNIHCILAQNLMEKFKPLFDLYSPIEDLYLPSELLDSWDGEFIWEKLNEDWEIFTSDDPQIHEEIVTSIFQHHEYDISGSLLLKSSVEMRREFWGDDATHDQYLNDAWDRFRQEIIFNNRFFPTRQIDVELIESLLPILEFTPSVENHLFRARISTNQERFLCENMGKPTWEKTRNGRANPLGISYLYISSDAETAIAETKPAINDKITVGTFLIKRKLVVIDLRNPKIDSPFCYGDKLEFVLQNINFLGRLGNELSKSVSTNLADLEYIPTQYLCELIKKNGYDGVAYQSSIASGYNLAIFNDSGLECLSTEDFEIKYTACKPTELQKPNELHRLKNCVPTRRSILDFVDDNKLV